MSNQIEQFLIEFVFKDKDVVAGMKKITDGFEKVNRESVNKTKKRVGVESLLAQKAQDKLHNQRMQQEMELLKLKIANEKKRLAASKRSSDPDFTIRNQRMLRGVERSQYFRSLGMDDQNKFRTQMQSALGRGDVEGFRDIAAASREVSKQLNRQRRETIGLATAQKGLADSTRNMLRSYISLFAISAGIGSINRVGQEFEGINSAMLAATGSQQEAAKQMGFLIDLSERLGLSLIDTSSAYSKFLFAGKGKISDAQTKELFTSLTELGTTLGISKERMKLSMNAIVQMLNKGKISS